MLGERETRRGMLYSGGDSDCIVHKVRLTLVTRTRRLEWCHLGRRVLSLHCEDRMNNSILTIKCTTVVLLLLVGVVGTRVHSRASMPLGSLHPPAIIHIASRTKFSCMRKRKEGLLFFEDNRIFLNRSRNMSSTPSGPLLSAHNFFQYFSN